MSVVYVLTLQLTTWYDDSRIHDLRINLLDFIGKILFFFPLLTQKENIHE